MAAKDVPVVLCLLVRSLVRSSRPPALTSVPQSQSIGVYLTAPARCDELVRWQRARVRTSNGGSAVGSW